MPPQRPSRPRPPEGMQATREAAEPSGLFAPSPRLDQAGVQTRSQAAREALLRTPPPDGQADNTHDTAPSTPLHQGIPPQTSTEPPGAPRKQKLRRTTQLSPSAPVRRLDFEHHPLLAAAPGSGMGNTPRKMPR